MAYTVKQLADLAGVSVRTLHYYDEIGLLTPDAYGENGYRYYDEDALLRLQQILFFRELDFRLDEIKAIIDRPDFDVLRALQTHRVTLAEKAARLGGLINTVDKTILRLKGELGMSDKELFEGFDEEKQKQYAEEARKRWGSESVDDSMKRWAVPPRRKRRRSSRKVSKFAATWLPVWARGTTARRFSRSSRGGINIYGISTSRRWSGCAAWGSCTWTIPTFARTMQNSIRSCQSFSAMRSRFIAGGWRRSCQ